MLTTNGSTENFITFDTKKRIPLHSNIYIFWKPRCEKWSKNKNSHIWDSCNQLRWLCIPKHFNSVPCTTKILAWFNATIFNVFIVDIIWIVHCVHYSVSIVTIYWKKWWRMTKTMKVTNVNPVNDSTMLWLLWIKKRKFERFESFSVVAHVTFSSRKSRARIVTIVFTVFTVYFSLILMRIIAHNSYSYRSGLYGADSADGNNDTNRHQPVDHFCFY